MKVFIDSPLLIYLNVLANSSYRMMYENFYIEILTKYKPFTDILVLDELIYVSRRKYNISYKVSIEFIQSNILPYVAILNLGEEEYGYAIEIMSKYSLKPSDAIHIGAMMKSNIITVVTEDRDFDKVTTLRRLWIT